MKPLSKDHSEIEGTVELNMSFLLLVQLFI